jgi:pimeloyl-ACP methyl ester carboxylesterase
MTRATDLQTSELRRSETFVDVPDGYRLWVEMTGDPERPALLPVMGANASGLGWPDELVELLSGGHFVVRYDHRDTGRSTHAFHERPYPIRALADDAIAVLGALRIARAHVVGMSLGGTLVQLLLGTARPASRSVDDMGGRPRRHGGREDAVHQRRRLEDGTLGAAPVARHLADTTSSGVHGSWTWGMSLSRCRKVSTVRTRSREAAAVR